jgi:hypothetical protein
MQSDLELGDTSMKRERSWMAISAIQYRTDLVAPDSPQIDLGFLLEVKAPTATVLAMMVRKSLTAEESDSLDAIARTQLSDPSKYLEAQCSKAFATFDGNVLEHLSKEHVWAFTVTPPHQKDIPAKVANVKRPETLVARAIEWLVREVEKAEQTGHDVKTSAKRAARRQLSAGHRQALGRFGSVSRASRRRDYSCRVTLGELEMRI